jgi:hypothetical protein
MTLVSFVDPAALCGVPAKSILIKMDEAKQSEPAPSVPGFNFPLSQWERVGMRGGEAKYQPEPASSGTIKLRYT